MQYYADEKAINALDQVIELATRLQEEASWAQSDARSVVVFGPGQTDNPELRDEAQESYDGHFGWVRKLAEDLNTAAKNLP